MRLFVVTGGRQDECKESRCSGDGPVIRFPFRLKHQPERCGYPGFQISCSPDKQTILELPYSLNLSVTGISYTSQQIYVSERDFCKNFSLSASPFQFMDIIQENYIFSCSESKADPSHDLIQALCGFSPNNPVYSVDPRYDLSSLDLSSCSMIYKSSFPWSFGTYNGGYSEMSSSMNWSRPACGDCEAQGKKCRSKESNSKEHDHEIECVDQPPKGAYYYFLFSHLFILYIKS